jgi:hypothetical protein
LPAFACNCIPSPSHSEPLRVPWTSFHVVIIASS